MAEDCDTEGESEQDTSHAARLARSSAS
jgi:hypothetical protein